MLNLLVHNVSTRSQSTENQNMLIYHDPGTVHALSTGFSCFSVNSQRDVPIINILFTSSLLENLYRVSNWRGVALTTHPNLVPRLQKSRAILLLPPWVSMVCSSVNFTLTFYIFLSCLFRVPTDSQRSGALKTCYRHPQMNYFSTFWQSTVIT